MVFFWGGQEGGIGRGHAINGCAAVCRCSRSNQLHHSPYCRSADSSPPPGPPPVSAVLGRRLCWPAPFASCSYANRQPNVEWRSYVYRTLSGGHYLPVITAVTSRPVKAGESGLCVFMHFLVSCVCVCVVLMEGRLGGWVLRLERGRRRRRRDRGRGTPCVCESSGKLMGWQMI